MNAYSIAADSPRWWWPSAAVGAAATAAVMVILVVPTTDTSRLDESVPAPSPSRSAVVDDRVTRVDPGLGRGCFAVRARTALAHDPTCGFRAVSRFPSGVRRPGPDSRP